MKLAMRLPENTSAGTAKDADPREEASSEVIDLASRTAYPAVANRKGAVGRARARRGGGLRGAAGAATLWGLNASRMAEEETVAAPLPAPAYEPDFAPPPLIEELPSANAVPEMYADPAPSAVYSLPAPDPAAATNPYASPTLVYDGAAVSTIAIPAVPGAEAAVPGRGRRSRQRLGG